MKGQYFSFDAIIATIIMVLAFSSLVAYWHGAQMVAESRTDDRLADANRIAESLLSPGSPVDWESHNLDEIRQMGIAEGFNNQLDWSKVNKLQAYANINRYDEIGNLLRAGGEYHILIERTNTAGGENVLIADIGKPHTNAEYVVVANRGATLEGRPVRMRVFLWK